MDRLAPPRHPGHAGPRLSRRLAQDRGRGRRPGRTWPPRSCRSPSPSCAACSGISSGLARPTTPPPSPGRFGAAAISNAHDVAIGSDALAMNSGCSTSTPRTLTALCWSSTRCTNPVPDGSTRSGSTPWIAGRDLGGQRPVCRSLAQSRRRDHRRELPDRCPGRRSHGHRPGQCTRSGATMAAATPRSSPWPAAA